MSTIICAGLSRGCDQCGLRIAKPLAPTAKCSLRSHFTSGGVSRLRRSILALRARCMSLSVTHAGTQPLTKAKQKVQKVHLLKKNNNNILELQAYAHFWSPGKGHEKYFSRLFTRICSVVFASFCSLVMRTGVS